MMFTVLPATIGWSSPLALPEASAGPSQTTLVPGSDSHNRVTVDVAVPADTEPGDYDVTLTATARGAVSARRSLVAMSYAVVVASAVTSVIVNSTGLFVSTDWSAA